MGLCKYCGTENNAHHSATCPVVMVQEERPIIEFPDVQRLIKQTTKFQIALDYAKNFIDRYGAARIKENLGRDGMDAVLKEIDKIAGG